MLIWLNGAHGAGKTSVAKAILKLRPGARLVDPEQIGFMLRRTWPAPLPDDFKDMPVWREMTVALLRSATAEAAGRLLIVPMTLARPEHFQDVVARLRLGDTPVHHFTLLASVSTLRRRLGRRLDWPQSRRWALARAEDTIAALQDDLYAEHIVTDTLSIGEVAQAVLDRAWA